MLKMFFATLGTETNTFSPIPTGWNAWKSFLLVHRNEPIQAAMDPAADFSQTAEKRLGNNTGAVGICHAVRPDPGTGL